MAASGRPEPAGTAIVSSVDFHGCIFVFELGWLMYTYTVMADAVNEGVRYAMVHAGGDVAGTQAKVKAFAWHVITQR